MIAYDEIYAIKFLGRKLRPYWQATTGRPRLTCSVRPSGITRSLVARCEAFDRS